MKKQIKHIINRKKSDVYFVEMFKNTLKNVKKNLQNNNVVFQERIDEVVDKSRLFGRLNFNDEKYLLRQNFRLVNNNVFVENSGLRNVSEENGYYVLSSISSEEVSLTNSIVSAKTYLEMGNEKTNVVNIENVKDLDVDSYFMYGSLATAFDNNKKIILNELQSVISEDEFVVEAIIDDENTNVMDVYFCFDIRFNQPISFNYLNFNALSFDKFIVNNETVSNRIDLSERNVVNRILLNVKYENYENLRLVEYENRGYLKSYLKYIYENFQQVYNLLYSKNNKLRYENYVGNLIEVKNKKAFRLTIPKINVRNNTYQNEGEIIFDRIYVGKGNKRITINCDITLNSGEVDTYIYDDNKQEFVELVYSNSFHGYNVIINYTNQPVNVTDEYYDTAIRINIESDFISFKMVMKSNGRSSPVINKNIYYEVL